MDEIFKRHREDQRNSQRLAWFESISREELPSAIVRACQLQESLTEDVWRENLLLEMYAKKQNNDNDTYYILPEMLEDLTFCSLGSKDDTCKLSFSFNVINDKYDFDRFVCRDFTSTQLPSANFYFIAKYLNHIGFIPKNVHTLALDHRNKEDFWGEEFTAYVLLLTS